MHNVIFKDLFYFKLCAHVGREYVHASEGAWKLDV